MQVDTASSAQAPSSPTSLASPSKSPRGRIRALSEQERDAIRKEVGGVLTSALPTAAIVREHRRAGQVIWGALISGFVAYCIYVIYGRYDARNNPPTTFSYESANWHYPDIAMCPPTGTWAYWNFVGLGMRKSGDNKYTGIDALQPFRNSVNDSCMLVRTGSLSYMVTEKHPTWELSIIVGMMTRASPTAVNTPKRLRVNYVLDSDYKANYYNFANVSTTGMYVDDFYTEPNDNFIPYGLAYVTSPTEYEVYQKDCAFDSTNNATTCNSTLANSTDSLPMYAKPSDESLLWQAQGWSSAVNIRQLSQQALFKDPVLSYPSSTFMVPQLTDVRKMQFVDDGNFNSSVRTGEKLTYYCARKGKVLTGDKLHIPGDTWDAYFILNWANAPKQTWAINFASWALLDYLFEEVTDASSGTEVALFLGWSTTLSGLSSWASNSYTSLDSLFTYGAYLSASTSGESAFAEANSGWDYVFASDDGSSSSSSSSGSSSSSSSSTTFTTTTSGSSPTTSTTGTTGTTGTSATSSAGGGTTGGTSGTTRRLMESFAEFEGAHGEEAEEWDSMSSIGPKRVRAIDRDLGNDQGDRRLRRLQAASEKWNAARKVGGAGQEGLKGVFPAEDDEEVRRLTEACSVDGNTCSVRKFTIYGGYYYLYMGDLLENGWSEGNGTMTIRYRDSGSSDALKTVNKFTLGSGSERLSTQFLIGDTANKKNYGKTIPCSYTLEKSATSQFQLQYTEFTIRNDFYKVETLVETDPVDWSAIIGVIGGFWAYVGAIFSILFVSTSGDDPIKMHDKVVKLLRKVPFLRVPEFHDPEAEAAAADADKPQQYAAVPLQSAPGTPLPTPSHNLNNATNNV